MTHARPPRPTSGSPARKAREQHITKRDPVTGVVVDESYFVNGRLHRDPAEGPARIMRDPVTGIATFEEYFVRGKYHRDPAEGPAIIRRNARGELCVSIYCVDGEDIDPRGRPCAPPSPSR